MLFDEVIERIDDYVGNFSSLKNFSAWFYALAYSVEKRGYSEQFVEFVNEIELILAEASSAGWSGADLKSELSSAIAPYRSSLIATVKPSSPSYASSLRGQFVLQKVEAI